MRSFILVSLMFALVGCSAPVTPADSGSDVREDAATDAPSADAPPADGGTDTHTAITQFCASAVSGVLEPFCAHLERCCTPAELSGGTVGFIYGFACHGMPADQDCANDLEGAIAAGRVRFDPAGVPACLSAQRALAEQLFATCGGLSDLSGGGLGAFDLPECAAAVRGLQADGAPCTQDYECVHQRCLQTLGSDEGRCSGPVPVGGACSGNHDCATNVCVLGTCRERVARDGECDANEDCGEGLFCRFDSATSTSSCQPQLAPGAACDAGDSCQRGACEEGRCVEVCVGSRTGG
jgi:hypothetical protein